MEIPDVNSSYDKSSSSEQKKTHKQEKIATSAIGYSNSLEDVMTVTGDKEKSVLTRKMSEILKHEDSITTLQPLRFKGDFYPVFLEQNLSQIKQKDLQRTFLHQLGISSKSCKIKLSRSIASSITNFPENYSLILLALIETRKEIEEMISKMYQEKKESKHSFSHFRANYLEKKLKKNWVDQGFCRELSDLLFHNDSTRNLVANYAEINSWADTQLIVKQFFEKENNPEKIITLIRYFTNKEIETNKNKELHENKQLFRTNSLSVALGIKYAAKFLKTDLKKFKEILDKHFKKFYVLGLSFGDLKIDYDNNGKRQAITSEKRQKFQLFFREFLEDFYSYQLSLELRELLSIRKKAFQENENEMITFVGKNLIFEIISDHMRAYYDHESPEQFFVLKILKIINLFSIDGNFADILKHDSVEFIDEPFYKEFRQKHIFFIKNL